jgi:hypothetical protein
MSENRQNPGTSEFSESPAQSRHENVVMVPHSVMCSQIDVAVEHAKRETARRCADIARAAVIKSSRWSLEDAAENARNAIRGEFRLDATNQIASEPRLSDIPAVELPLPDQAPVQSVLDAMDQLYGMKREEGK